MKEKSLWQKIMEVSRKAEYEKGSKWKFSNLDALSNDLLAELGEFASNIKTFEGRGTHNRDKPKPTFRTFTEEFFDFYIYIVLGLESMNVDEDLFNEVGNQKLTEIKKRLGIE